MGRPREIDNAVFGDSLLGGMGEASYSGVVSFMRRRLTRDLSGVDVVVWGIPFDGAVSNRPGARFGPEASAAPPRCSPAIRCGRPEPIPSSPWR